MACTFLRVLVADWKPQHIANLYAEGGASSVMVLSRSSEFLCKPGLLSASFPCLLFAWPHALLICPTKPIHALACRSLVPTAPSQEGCRSSFGGTRSPLRSLIQCRALRTPSQPGVSAPAARRTIQQQDWPTKRTNPSGLAGHGGKAGMPGAMNWSRQTAAGQSEVSLVYGGRGARRNGFVEWVRVGRREMGGEKGQREGKGWLGGY